jgi:hypothetical protein
MSTDEYYKSLSLLLMAIFYIIALLLSNSIVNYTCITMIVSLNILVLAKHVYAKKLLIAAIFLLPSTLAVFISTLMFLTSHLLFWQHAIDKAIYINACLLMVRAGSLGFCSMACFMHLDFTELTIQLRRQINLPITAVYVILCMYNAFHRIYYEYFRMRNVYRMRYGTNIISYRLIYHLILSAANYANTVSTNIIARGNLSRTKYFSRTTMLHFAQYNSRLYYLMILNLTVVCILIY